MSKDWLGGGSVMRFRLEGCLWAFLPLVSCQALKKEREGGGGMMNVMKEEGEIKKVENLSPSGGLCSLPGMSCQSE